MTTPALAEHVRGKGRHYKHPDGTLVPSVTNVIGIMDKPALPRWAAKMVAETAYRMRNALPEMTEAEAVDLLKSSPWNSSKRAADRGTDIHGYLEALLNRQQPDELSPDAAPFKAAADDWFENVGCMFEDVRTEATLFHPAYAGTTDLIAYRNGRWLIVDFKTSKAIYDEAALQLAALSGCYTFADGEPVPWAMSEPELVVVRIGVDGWDDKVVANREASLAAFHGLLAAWEWKHEKAYR